jgi:CheY-like chemotaxis protein
LRVGTIDVDDAEAPDPLKPIPPTPTGPPRMNDEQTDSPPTIAIICGHVGQRLVLSSAYRQSGFVTVEADSGIEALARLSTGAPDVMVLGAQIAAMSTTDLRDGIRAHPNGRTMGLIIIDDEVVDLTTVDPHERRLLNPVTWHDLYEATLEVVTSSDPSADTDGSELLTHLRGAAAAEG